MRKHRINSLAGIALVLVAGVLSFGCKKKGQAPPPPSVASNPAAKSPSQPTAPAVQKQLSSAQTAANRGPEFDFTKKKDPFKPFTPQVQQQAKPQANLPKKDALPIQSFEASRFKVAGIIAGLKENRALLIDPTGKGYVVRQGMQVGLNDGYITKISSTAVEIMEQYREDSGRKLKRTIRLTLPQKK